MLGRLCHIDTVHIIGMTRLTGRPVIGIMWVIRVKWIMMLGSRSWC
jgi:hypothetical protein